ncbi:AT-rich interactive domain-containing protein 2-like [Andrographis paniculata]|uniref:AT-rich interactive domain-containing protein 2-like n=1 Tax=Andrographis paniculata TaxID=175694 RepID=UPI0021E79E97|nr:AT-rich interactive domain-containing protein 2-like [Andrographis paniculata]
MAGFLNASVEESSFALEKDRECRRRRQIDGDRRLKQLFDEFLERFLNQIPTISHYRPLPPVVDQGKEIDLFKLHCVVRSRGGYCIVSENRLWSSVAADCGVDPNAGAALKLVYVKYLDTLDRFLRKIVEDRRGEKGGFGNLVDDLELGLEVVLCGDEEMGNAKDEDGKLGHTEDVEGSGKDDGGPCRKRKRECCLGVLKWLHNVAKDPCSRDVGTMPEMQKWKSYGSEVQWKQILMAREAVLVKKIDQSVWQRQKMHPSMYDDDRCGSGRLRCSRRLKDSSRKPEAQHTPESTSSHQSNEDTCEKQSDQPPNPPNFWEKPSRGKRILTGQQFQVELPEFSGADEYQSDSKWLGTKTWPLEKGEYRPLLIERDPMGKGRQEVCGCSIPSSPECIRFHIQEKRTKLKLELGPAFNNWKFDNMGESVALTWTEPDMNKFKNVVESNQVTDEKYFWKELFKSFPKKGREALVSYYFNVYLLRRRGKQNRVVDKGGDIYSDDDGSEYGPISKKFGPTSIFHSPKKPPRCSAANM